MTTYRTIEVDGIDIFYREAGPASAPTILLLHGFPSSSRMWEPLLTRLGDAFHLVAPDYPGFGHSDTPDPAVFAYTFDHLAEVIDGFTAKLGLTRYVLFLQDYGGPIGFRLALAHPDRVQALIVQNAVAHEDGLGPLWEARRQFWAHRAEHETTLRENFFSPAATRQRHVGTSPTPETTTRITGPMSSRSCIAPAKPTSRQTCSSITRRTSRATPPGRSGFGSISRRCW